MQDVDADRFDAALAGFVQQRCAALAPPGRRRALAIDGKTVRGSRSTGPDGEQPARHLLAVIDQHTRVVLGQVGVDGKTNEISRFAPLLDTLTALDLTGVVITADALHTQREHVETLATRGAHWVLTVKGNQPRLRRQLAGLPWREVASSGSSRLPTGVSRRRRSTPSATGCATAGCCPSRGSPICRRQHRRRGQGCSSRRASRRGARASSARARAGRAAARGRA